MGLELNANKLTGHAGWKKPIIDTLNYINKYKFIYLLLLPGVIYFAVFDYGPLYFLQVAFKDYNIFLGLKESKWVGFANFQKLFATRFFMQAFTNTVIISLM